MASGPRDLTFRFLSDTDRFDLTDPARSLDDLADEAKDTTRELEQLGDADPNLDRLERDAEDTGRALDKLGDEAKTTGRRLDDLGDDAKHGRDDLDKLGDEAKATADRVDDAFDAIAKSSRANMRKVDDDLDRAGEGMDEFKDEAAGSAREAAASFSGGFEDIGDLIQETAANAFAGFGPAGAVAGIAAAAGIGLVTNAINAAKERVHELAQGLLDLRLDSEIDTQAGRIRQALDQLKDDGDLGRFKTAAERAGVAWSDYVKALAGDEDALARVRAKLAENADGLGGLESITTDAGRASQDLYNRLKDQGLAIDEADTAAAAYSDGTLTKLIDAEEAAAQAAEDHAEAVSSLGDAIDGFAEPASIYQELLSEKEEAERKTAEKTAAATKNQKDSWEDYVKGASVSVDEYLDKLEEQVVAQEKWAENLSTLARRGVEEGVLEQLARMGPEGAPLIAKLTTASDAELAKLVSLYDRQGKAAGDSVAEGILDATPRVKGNASELHREVKDRLSGRVNVPVGVSGPSSGDLYRLRSNIRGALSGITVNVNAIAQAALGRRYAP